MTNSPASKRAIRAGISLAYGALAGGCALFADAAIPTIIGLVLGIAAGVWVKAPKLFKI